MKSTYRTSLIVAHPTMDASVISQSVSLDVVFSRSVGNPRKTPKGTPLDGVYKSTVVKFAVTDGVNNFDDELFVGLIEQTLNLLPVNLLQDIVDTGGECFYSIGLFSDENVMFYLNPSLLKKLSTLGVGIKFDFYGGEDEAPEY